MQKPGQTQRREIRTQKPVKEEGLGCVRKRKKAHVAAVKTAIGEV